MSQYTNHWSNIAFPCISPMFCSINTTTDCQILGSALRWINSKQQILVWVLDSYLVLSGYSQPLSTHGSGNNASVYDMLRGTHGSKCGDALFLRWRALVGWWNQVNNRVSLFHFWHSDIVSTSSIMFGNRRDISTLWQYTIHYVGEGIRELYRR